MITASGWCRCGHESAVHRFGKDNCVANICECAKFEQAGPSTPTGAVAGPPDRHRFWPVLGELEDLCHCATCGLPRDHVSHDPPVAGPPDLAHAIQAAEDALWEQKGLIWSPAAIQRQAQLCVEAAWKVWSGEA